jgi:hypothetical protein
MSVYQIRKLSEEEYNGDKYTKKFQQCMDNDNSPLNDIKEFFNHLFNLLDFKHLYEKFSKKFNKFYVCVIKDKCKTTEVNNNIKTKTFNDYSEKYGLYFSKLFGFYEENDSSTTRKNENLNNINNGKYNTNNTFNMKNNREKT